jgi:hypothetical protein
LSIDATARQRLDAELAQLNEDVDRAIATRKAWMDAHMTDYARYQVGDVLYDLDTGRRLGTVVELYRYWGSQDDPRFDRSMAVHYRYGSDNTSRQPGLRYGSHDEYVQECERRLERARNPLSEDLLRQAETAMRAAWDQYRTDGAA